MNLPIVTYPEPSLLSSFKRLMRKNIDDRILLLREQQEKLPLLFNVAHIDHIYCSNDLAKTAIIEVLSCYNAKITLYKVWHSFWIQCTFIITQVDCENDITHVEYYTPYERYLSKYKDDKGY